MLSLEKNKIARERGDESELTVMDVLEDHKKRRSLVADYRRNQRGSIEDDTERDITVIPVLKLPLLMEFYLQVKTSRTGEFKFRAKILRQLEGRLTWLRTASEVEKGRMVNLELLKRRIIVLVVGEENNLDADFDLRVAELYTYWQERSRNFVKAKDRKKQEKEYCQRERGGG